MRRGLPPDWIVVHGMGGSVRQRLPAVQSKRTQDNHCSSCKNGYYLAGMTCAAYAGSCAHGKLTEQGRRIQNNHCGSCDAGYFLT